MVFVTCNQRAANRAQERELEVQPGMDNTAELVIDSGQMSPDPEVVGMRKSTRAKRRSTKLEGYACEGIMRGMNLPLNILSLLLLSEFSLPSLLN